ncbi:MAG: hypothetical protein ACI87A_000283 [Planctomycetota bacterium]|jgi:hypothetical protein
MIALVLAAACLLSPGCNLFGGSDPGGEWTEAEFSAASENVIWKVVLAGLDKRGFPRGAGLDPENMIAVSGWRRALAPFRGEGHQTKARIEITPLEDDQYTIRVRVLKQLNMALVNPGDARYAEWEWAPDDEIEAKILMQHFRTYLDAELGDF